MAKTIVGVIHKWLNEQPCVRGLDLAIQRCKGTDYHKFNSLLIESQSDVIAFYEREQGDDYSPEYPSVNVEIEDGVVDVKVYPVERHRPSFNFESHKLQLSDPDCLDRLLDLVSQQFAEPIEA
jgi:hypothetical protein